MFCSKSSGRFEAMASYLQGIRREMCGDEGEVGQLRICIKRTWLEPVRASMIAEDL